MKYFGIVLIVLQVLVCIVTLAAGTHSTGGVAFWLGEHFVGLLGVALIVIGRKGKTKRKKLINELEKTSMVGVSQDVYTRCAFIRCEKSDAELKRYLKELVQKQEITIEQAQRLFYEYVWNINMKF